MSTQPGRFIVVEGLDGAGTTTQSERLVEWLRRERGVDAVLTGEPTDGPFGKLARHMVDTHAVIESRSLALLFAADRNEHLFNPTDGIVGHTKAGRWVVCDRYLLSGLAYQAADGVDLDELLQMNSFAPDPDLTIFLDVAPEACLDRVASRGTSSSRYETSQRMALVWSSYNMLNAAGHGLGRLEPIDGNTSIDEVATAVSGAVDRMYPR